MYTIIEAVLTDLVHLVLREMCFCLLFLNLCDRCDVSMVIIINFFISHGINGGNVS